MAINSEELRKAMDTLGISDIHIDREQAKKIYKKLLMKWHPDACPDSDERFYNEISAKINSAYEIIEKAYEEGLMGPNAKTLSANSYSSNYSSSYSSNGSNYSDYSYNNDDAAHSESSYTNSSNNNSSSGNSTNSQNYNNSYTNNDSQTTAAKDDADKYTSYEYFDSPSGLDILYFRERWLNIIFLTVCTVYIINAILKSTQTDIYIENSVINLIKFVAIYYAFYWFCKCFVACDNFLIAGIIAWLIYKATTTISMFIYNKIDPDYEWLAMLLFIAVFFLAEYFVHIKKILLTFDIKVRNSTTFLSYLMLIEYAIMLVFGIYSVILVHKYIAIRNVIIPPWY